MKKILSTLIITAMLLGSVLTAYADNSISDIQNHWGEKNIKELVSMGAINGYPDGTFKPENNISYAEYLTILVKTTKAGNGDYSTSGNDEWYSGVIKAAQQSGIISAYEIKDFNAPINRADAAMYTEKAVRLVLGEAEINLEGAERLIGDYSSFKNTEESYFIVQQYARGILAGKDSKGTFDANSNLSRAEAATIILRTVKTENRKTITQADIPTEETSIVYEAGNFKGCMKREIAKEYNLQALETARFYKEGGKLYISMDLPELPEGFSWRVGVLSHAKDSEGNVLTVFGVSNKRTDYINGNKFFVEVVSDAPGISIEDITDTELSIRAVNSDGKYYIYNSLFTNKPNQVYSRYAGTQQEWSDFNTSNIFKW